MEKSGIFLLQCSSRARSPPRAALPRPLRSPGPSRPLARLAEVFKTENAQQRSSGAAAGGGGGVLPKVVLPKHLKKGGGGDPIDNSLSVCVAPTAAAAPRGPSGKVRAEGSGRSVQGPGRQGVEYGEPAESASASPPAAATENRALRSLLWTPVSCDPPP